MKRALTWLAGLAGIAALLRRRSRQKGATPELAAPAAAPAAAPDPADELRQKLDETRVSDPETETPASLDERRARVHERAQEAIDLMHGPDDNPPAS